MAIHYGTEKNTWLGLLFVETDPGDLPMDPVAHVYLQTKAKRAVKGTDGLYTLTPECVSEQEIDYWVDSLKRELDEVGRDAKRRFRRYDERLAKERATPPSLPAP